MKTKKYALQFSISILLGFVLALVRWFKLEQQGLMQDIGWHWFDIAALAALIFAVLTFLRSIFGPGRLINQGMRNFFFCLGSAFFCALGVVVFFINGWMAITFTFRMVCYWYGLVLLASSIPRMVCVAWKERPRF